MRITEPAPNEIGATITDVKVPVLTRGEIDGIKEAVYRDKLVVFRNQSPGNAEYVELARLFGTPQIYFQPNYHHPEHPEIFVSSNELYDGKKFGVSGTGRYWHTDYSFMTEPLSLTMVRPVRIPDGNRGTHYTDMERVWAELPDVLRALVEGRRAIHEGKYRYKIQDKDIDRALIDVLTEIAREVPAVTHPAVIHHPVRDADSLYINEGFTTGIVGSSDEAGRAALAKLFAFASEARFVHSHAWRSGDILFWDNRTLNHMAANGTTTDQVSTSFRIGVYDGLPFYTNPDPGSLLG
ncbi:MAG: TauD/TfdA family dioxygenase [Kofleriaceae bacterium]